MAHTIADAAACSTEFHSAHLESLREALSTVDMNDKEARVEAEIKASKVHWSELTSAYVTAGVAGAVKSTSTSTLEWEERSKLETTEEWNERVAKDNVEVFQSLQARYPGGFFVDDNNVGLEHVLELLAWMQYEDGKFCTWGVEAISNEKPFAEGVQAQLFHAHVVYIDGDSKEGLAMKVFKEGTFLRDLCRLLPPSMLNNKHVEDKGWLSIVGCNIIIGAWLLKADGRFAFLMLRAWGDLRKLINTRMLRNNNHSASFLEEVACWCMVCVVNAMQSLHAKGIVQRDLKATNKLVFIIYPRQVWQR